MSWILCDTKVGSRVIQDRSLLFSGICTVLWQSGDTLQHHKVYSYSWDHLLLQDATWHGNRTVLAATSINFNTIWKRSAHPGGHKDLLSSKDRIGMSYWRMTATGHTAVCSLSMV